MKKYILGMTIVGMLSAVNMGLAMEKEKEKEVNDFFIS